MVCLGDERCAEGPAFWRRTNRPICCFKALYPPVQVAAHHAAVERQAAAQAAAAAEGNGAGGVKEGEEEAYEVGRLRTAWHSARKERHAGHSGPGAAGGACPGGAVC